VILVSKFARVPPCFTVLFQTLIGPATLMIDALPVVMLSFWGQISLHGVRATKLRSLIPILRQNIRFLPMLLWNCLDSECSW
jgi:hypothetical protein